MNHLKIPQAQAQLALAQHPDWTRVLNAVFACLTQAAHESGATPALAHSQRCVQLTLAQGFVIAKNASQTHAITRALAARLKSDFSVRTFTLLQGQETDHQLLWTHF